MKVSILGAGNVAFHLSKAISENKDLELFQIYNRSDFKDAFFSIKAEKINQIEDLKPCDLIIICVKDEAIAEVSQQIPFKNQLVVHTSGNTDLKALSEKHQRGVLYPVQSFSMGKDLYLKEVPFCVEAEEAQNFETLSQFAEKIGKKAYPMNSLQRKYLHISAVFLNNFTNHLWFLSQRLCLEQNIDFELLRPLLQETFLKSQSLPFYDCQTGPAKRKDLTTIGIHESLLEGQMLSIYQEITSSILKTY